MGSKGGSWLEQLPPEAATLLSDKQCQRGAAKMRNTNLIWLTHDKAVAIGAHSLVTTTFLLSWQGIKGLP